MDPTLDGNSVFGSACHCEVIPNPRATQRDAYPGQNGTTALDCGARGGRVRIRGVLISDVPADCTALAAALLAYADGQTHVLTDTFGNTWNNVYFTGQYQPNPDGAYYSAAGWCLPYSCELEILA